MRTTNSSDTGRKFQHSEYGTWLAANEKYEYYVRRCTEQIGKYKIWSENLELLLSEKKAEMLNAKKEDIRELLSLYSLDEITAIHNESSN